jgi:GNAT superfamily N-acetyltransferase
MTETHRIEIEQLRLSHALALAPLIAAYSQALKRGAPRQPDQYYAEQLLQDRTAEFLGAFLDGVLVGFVMFYDLPEPVSGLRCGQADHIYVHHDHRGKGIAKALVDVLADQAPARGWSKLMLNAPKFPETGRKVFESVAVPADWHSYVLRFDR